VSDELSGATVAVHLDRQRLERLAWSSSTTRAVARAARAAESAGVQGTPSFEIGRTGGPMQLVPADSLDAALAQ
jgi:predicted DsbA family dithiol-disulfide isomerase